MKLSIETGILRTRIAVACHKPCEGCGRSWDECDGGWLDAAGEAASWRCDDCSEPPVYCGGGRECGCNAAVHMSGDELVACLSGAAPWPDPPQPTEPGDER